MAAHLGHDTVSAIMCPTDTAALDVLEVLRVRGESQLSVTGYDGYGPLAAPYLGLTTFRQPQEEMGRTAISMLVDQIEGITSQDRFVSLSGTVVPGRTAGEYDRILTPPGMPSP